MPRLVTGGIEGAKKLKRKLFKRQVTTLQSERVKPWFAANGDKTLRLNYSLNKRSIVFDLGGYEGQWASDIYSKYLATIYVFEPMPEYAKNIKERFKKNPDIKIFTFGLSNEDKEISLTIDGDASSVIKESDDAVNAELKNATTFIDSLGVRKIDLMKINIEGGEYDLLDHLIETGWIKNIDNIQVQFHDFFDEAEARMIKIQAQLKKTHKITYQYPFVWENWKRK